MSAAGIIAHCLTPASATSLVWWSAGDGVVQKVRNDGVVADDYSIGGSDIRQAITADVTRNRVFVPTSGGLYIFEDATANGAIPAPVIVAIPDMGTQNSWAYMRGVALDEGTGQLFLAGSTADEVTIVDTDNSTTSVVVDNALSVHALGSGKFSVVSNGIDNQVWGPSNGYATPLIDDTFADAVTMATVYDPDTDNIICYLETDEGGLRTINATNGATGFVAIGGRYGSVMCRDADTGYVVVNQTGDNGKLWVHNPSTGALISSIDYSTEEPGATPSGAPVDMKSMNGVLCVLQRWTIDTLDYIVAYLFDITTGTMLNWDYLPGTDSGLAYAMAADPVSGLFGMCDTSSVDFFTFDSADPYTYSNVDMAATGSNTSAYTYSPDD